MTHNADIAARMTDYFKRQIAWFEQVLAEWDSVLTDLEAERLDELLARQEQDAVTTRQLEREFWALDTEWTEAVVSEVERAEVRRLAARAEALATELGAMCERAAAAASGQAATVKDTLQETQRGHAMLRK